MKKSVPVFIFDVPISREGDELKIVDLRMLNEAKEFTRRKKRKKNRRTVDDEEDVPSGDGNEPESGDDDFLDDDQFTMIDDEFRGAEEYNTHMGRLGSVIRNIEMRERRIKTSLLRKTGREIEREEEIAQEETRKRRLKRKKKKKKKKKGATDAAKLSPVAGRKKKEENEYDLADNFIDDDIYGDYVRMGGSSEEEDDDLIDMSNWIQDDEAENELGYPYTAPKDGGKRRASVGRGLSTPFQVPPSPHRDGRPAKRKKGDFEKSFKPDFVAALNLLENKCKQLKSGNVKKSKFKWDDVADELYGVALMRGKYFKKGVPKKLTEVLLNFPVLGEFSEGTIRKNLRDYWSIHEVSELDRKVEEYTTNIKQLILSQYHRQLSEDISIGPPPSVADPMFLSLVREKRLKVQWDNQLNQLFYMCITKLRLAVQKTNSLKKKKGKYSRKKRVLEDDVHEKYNQIKLVMPNDKDLSFVQKYKELENYYKLNPLTGPPSPKKQVVKKKRGRPKTPTEILVPPPPPPAALQTSMSNNNMGATNVLSTQQPGNLGLPQLPLVLPNLANASMNQLLMPPVPNQSKLMSSASTSMTVTPLATPPIQLNFSQTVPATTNTTAAGVSQQQQQQESPSTPTKSDHLMRLRARPEKAFFGELSPGASRKDGDLLLDDEDEDDDEELEEEEELRTPERRRSNMLNLEEKPIVAPPPLPTTTATTTTTTVSVEKEKEKEVEEEELPDPQITGKKRERTTDEEKKGDPEVILLLEGEREKKKRKLELPTVQ